MGVHASRAWHSRPCEDRRQRHHHRARDRRGLHARIYQGMETADEGAAQHRGQARAVNRMAQVAHDPSTSSYYVNDAFYRELVDNFANWQRDELAVTDAAERDRFRMLVEREARLLGQLAFD